MTADDRKFDTIICIGAGQGNQVAEWRAAGARRVVLVEPNPAFRAKHEALMATCPEVEVISAAVAAQDGTAPLQVFNLDRHSSLRKPDGLTDLLPGLRLAANVTVQTLTVASLLVQLGTLTGKIALFLDAPGAEIEVLQGFVAAGGLDRFTAIDLICTEDVQYEGAASRATLQALIEASGFVLTASDLSDPDWPHLTFHSEPKGSKVADLTDQLQQVSTLAETLQDRVMLHMAFAAAAARDIAEVQAETEAANATIARLQSALRQDARPKAAEGVEIVSATQDQQDLVEKLAAERARVAQLTAIVQSSDDALADLHAALLAARAEIAAKADALAVQAERIGELEFRQRQARDELRRFEGQMDLIKDLLLRGERL